MSVESEIIPVGATVLPWLTLATVAVQIVGLLSDNEDGEQLNDVEVVHAVATIVNPIAELPE